MTHTVTDLTAVSLFAGVGGIDLALERNGVRVVAAVEIDKAARGVLHDQFPNTTLLTDVTKVTADELRAAGFVPERGVLTAGFPCQDLSVAGRRRGMASGTRSGLWWHVVRLLADLRPRWFIGENVPGLLSACCPCLGDGRCGSDCPGELHPVPGGACGPGRCMVEHGGAMGAVLGSLGDLGYGFAHRVLDAQHFGVPQRRRRVVIVGCLGDDRRPVEVLLEPESSSGDSAPGQPEGARVAATLTAGAHGAGVSAPGRRHEDDVNLVVSPPVTAKWSKGTGGPAGDEAQNLVVATLQGGGKRGHRVDAESAAGGHLVPMTFQKTTRPATSDHPDVWEEREVAATLSPFDLGSESRAVELVVHPLAVRGREDGAQLEVGPEGGPYNALRAGDGASASQPLIAITSVLGDHTHALTAEGHDASEDGTGRGTPIIAFDPKAGGDHTSSGSVEDGTGITPTMQGGRPHAAAYAVEPDSGQGADLRAREVAVASALTATDNARQTDRGLRVTTETTVRRLTPRECERLQGFSDDHTATSNGKRQADGPRYQQMGNTVAVPVFVWVVGRIVKVNVSGASR